MSIFSGKKLSKSSNSTLLEKSEFLTNDIKIVKTFSKRIKKLDIDDNQSIDIVYEKAAVYSMYPSIARIKVRLKTQRNFLSKI